jgi:hypothetical protein
LYQVGACGFEELPVLHSCRTDGLARATTQTAIDMLPKSIGIGSKALFFDSAHEVKPSPRTIILITGVNVGRTRLKTEPAMNTGEELVSLRRKSGC